MIDGFYTAEEIKPLLGIKARPGDLRTLNKYVLKGKLEMRALSPRVKLYRLCSETVETMKKKRQTWIFAFESSK